MVPHLPGPRATSRCRRQPGTLREMLHDSPWTVGGIDRVLGFTKEGGRARPWPAPVSCPLKSPGALAEAERRLRSRTSGAGRSRQARKGLARRGRERLVREDDPLPLDVVEQDLGRLRWNPSSFRIGSLRIVQPIATTLSPTRSRTRIVQTMVSGTAGGRSAPCSPGSQDRAGSRLGSLDCPSPPPSRAFDHPSPRSFPRNAPDRSERNLSRRARRGDLGARSGRITRRHSNSRARGLSRAWPWVATPSPRRSTRGRSRRPAECWARITPAALVSMNNLDDECDEEWPRARTGNRQGTIAQELHKKTTRSVVPPRAHARILFSESRASARPGGTMVRHLARRRRLSVTPGLAPALAAVAVPFPLSESRP